MENASKALIIAGAILIAILLIGVGVMVMRGASAPVEQATDQLAAQTIEMFNSKFTGYSGIQSAAMVKELISSIQANNGANPKHQIKCEEHSVINGITTNDFSFIQSNVKKEKKYNVYFYYGGGWTSTWEKGYLFAVQILEIN